MDIRRDRLRHAAGQHGLEMAPGKGVLTLEIEGAGKLEADADETGVRHQHLAEGGDRLVKQCVAAVFVLLHDSLLHRLHALLEQGAHVLSGGGKGEQQEQGRKETAHGDPFR